ncbi:MAG: hypothetical protein ACRCY8_03725 [Dermatophilaceae bacterium]
MRTPRRAVLRLGAAALATGVGALAYRTVDQGVLAVGRGPAYATWTVWDRGSALETSVAAAVLAANPHDVQPWRFVVDRAASTVEVRRDPTRTIGAVDPFLREVHVGLGCAVENLTVVARSRGYRPQVDPRAAGNRVARIELDPGRPERSMLAAAVPRRHTNRFAYRAGEPVATGVLRRLDRVVADVPGVSVRWLTAPTELQRFRDETYAATEAFVEDADQSRDSHAWFRHDWDELQAEASGLTYDGSLDSRLFAALAKVAPDLGESASNSGFLDATRLHVDTAATAGVVVAERSLAPDETDAREAWLAAGRLWQRLHLAATVEGLVAQPLNQLAERTDRERQLGLAPRFGEALDDLVGDRDLVAVMPFRIGYSTRDAGPTPRRPLARVVEYAD